MTFIPGIDLYRLQKTRSVDNKFILLLKTFKRAYVFSITDNQSLKIRFLDH